MLVLGLGSNVGDRLAHLHAAVEASVHGPHRVFSANVRISRIYESPALLPADAPEEWNTAFFNMAIAGEPLYGPDETLRHTQAIERLGGRQRRGHWGPREIDIDILVYGTTTTHTEHLTIPHPHLLTRRFALQPMAELLPEWMHPAQPNAKPAHVLAEALAAHEVLHLTPHTILTP